MNNSFNNISWLLGYYLDGWAELIEGMGDLAPNIKLGMIDQLNQRQMPRITVGETVIKEGLLTDVTRPFVETSTSPGARTLIYIEQHGNDLYASWRSYLRPTINWRLILRYATTALIISFIVIAVLWLFSTFIILKMVFDRWNSEPFFTAFKTWLGYYAAIFFGTFVLTKLLGLLKNNDIVNIIAGVVLYLIFVAGFISSLFIKDTGQTMYHEISLLFTSIKNGLLFLALPLSIIPLATNILYAILIAAALFGLFIRKNIFAFILKEPSIFDADDIIAMNLSVHKSMLRVLDDVVIDSSKLRLKGS